MVESVNTPSVFESDVCVTEEAERINSTSVESNEEEESRPTDLLGRTSESGPVIVIVSSEEIIVFVVSIVLCVPVCSVTELNWSFLCVNA